MFDAPLTDSQTLEWRITAPIEERPWNVGLIVGPSGSGKSTVLESAFGRPKSLEWGGPSVFDDFEQEHTVAEISAVCSAVGFNTIPAWVRPYHVLSTGEKFRADIARTMLAARSGEVICVDEFTSVVDRQVAQIGAHAVAKYVRRNDLQIVVASCHYDIMEWLQPDWVIYPADGAFEWRSVQPRPRIEITVQPVTYETWHRFAPYHYLTAELNKAARCYAAFVGDEPVGFAAMLRRPHPRTRNIWGVSRVVVMPDWQGVGIAFALLDTLGAVYKCAGERVRAYPAHPSFIASFARSPRWAMTQRPGYGSQVGFTQSPKSTMGATVTGPVSRQRWKHGSRPCAVFEYRGNAWADTDQARDLLRSAHGHDIGTFTNTKGG